MSDFWLGLGFGLALVALYCLWQDETRVLVRKEVAANLAAQGETA